MLQYPDIGANKRLINFAFENSLNSVSEVHKIPTGYVVAQISEVISDGLEKFEDIQPKVRQLVVMERQFEKVTTACIGRYEKGWQ